MLIPVPIFIPWRCSKKEDRKGVYKWNSTDWDFLKAMFWWFLFPALLLWALIIAPLHPGVDKFYTNLIMLVVVNIWVFAMLGFVFSNIKKYPPQPFLGVLFVLILVFIGFFLWLDVTLLSPLLEPHMHNISI